jgi:hypothetical protein
VIPNPVLNNFLITGNFSVSERVLITITDVSGRKVRSFYENVITGFNSITVNSLSNLRAGIYFIEVKGNSADRKTKFFKME